MLLAAKRPTRINRHDRASRAAAVDIWPLHPSGGSNKEPECGISYNEARKAWETTKLGAAWNMASRATTRRCSGLEMRVDGH